MGRFRRSTLLKEKKPIDRSKFFSWFNKVCKKDKFKEYKKDGDKIFEEFTAVIGGGDLLGEEGKERYAKLGKRQSMFPKDKRGSIYDFFKEYKEFVEKDPKYYDPNLIAHECTEEKNYDAVVVDEVEDLTESTLDLILKSLKDESKGSFILCGDVNQVIHPSFFSLSKLKSFFCQNEYIIAQESEIFYTLEKSYRNSEQVTEVGNRILHLKNYCFGSEDRITEEEKKLFFMESDTENRGNVCFVTKDKEQEMAEKVPWSINWAVLVLDDEKKEEARKLFSTPLVFNIHEAKGLEFENVILYKFTSHEAYNKIWNIVCPGKSDGEVNNTINRIRDSYNEKNVKTSRNKNKEDKSSEEYKFHINALYVGVTRSASNLYIIDDKSNLLKIIEPKEKGNVNIKKEESSLEEWRDMALKLIDEGNVEQAKDIAAKKLSDKGEQKYAEEIINALKAQGYNKEVEEIELHFSLYKGKSDSELKIDTENPSYQFPEGCLGGNTESKVSTRKATEDNKKILKQKYGKRSKNNRGKGVSDSIKQFEQKEKLPELKVDRELRKTISLSKIKQKHFSKEEILSCAAQDGDFEMAKYLIGDGVDVNARAGDATPLHLAAQNGHYDVVKLLLQHKADVNARITEISMENFTPLHLAVQTGQYYVIELLLQHKADVNAQVTKIGMENSTPLHIAAIKCHAGIVKLLLDYGANVNAKDSDGATPLCMATHNDHWGVVDLLLADPSINVGCVNLKFVSKKEANKRKLITKRIQDQKLFEKVKKAAKEVDKNKLNELLKETEKLLQSKNEYGFKPSLNYSPDGSDKNTTIKIAIGARGELLKLLYDYAEENIGADSEIFKQLKHAKENPQPRSGFNDVSTPHNLAQAQVSIT